MASQVVGVFCSVLIFSLTTAPSSAVVDANPPFSQAISDLKEAIVKGLGFKGDEFRISGFDMRDGLVGHSIAYEFDVEIDDKIIPVKLLEDVKQWDYVDLPIFRVEDHQLQSVGQNGLMDERNKLGEDRSMGPILAPFQLAGPMELWIQGAKHIRLSLPHDVDAGNLRKVILAEGDVVTVKGAKSVSLRHPIDLPLPLNRTQSGFASGLVSLAEHLRHASRTKGSPPLSLRIVGATSITSPSSSNHLKLKRISPRLVELSSPSNKKPTEASDPHAVDLSGESSSLLTPTQFTTLWPLASSNGTNSKLLGLEMLLSTVLGPKANKKGSFRLLKADVSAQTFLKIGFGVEKKLQKGDGFEFNVNRYPEWRTKPEKVRMHFEVIAKVDGDKIVPEKVTPVKPVVGQDSVARNVAMGNVTMSRLPIFYQPSIPFTL